MTVQEVAVDRYVTLELRTLASAPSRGDVVALLQEHGAHRSALEEVWIVAVDPDQCRSIARVAVGTYHNVQVSVPAVLAVPLVAGASSFVVAHNHPNGRMLPSQQDYTMTEELVAAANAAGLTVEDHLILSPNGQYLSFRDAHVLAVPDNTSEPLEVRA